MTATHVAPEPTIAGAPPRMLTTQGWPFDPDRQPEDYGFFGPGSVTWKLWAAPTALLAFQRSVVLEHFDPFLTAAVADQAGIYNDPRGRLDSTLSYFLTVAVADGRSAAGSAELLQKVHARATGIEPISGKRYSANDPDSQLWIHLTGWHSILKCYEMFGPGPLTAQEEAQYWADCAVAAQLQTCRNAEIPTDRDGVRDYFAQVRPTLCTSERAQKAMHYLLRTPVSSGGRQFAAISRLSAPAVIATLPRWMRELGDMDQPRVVDAVYPHLMRPAIRAASDKRAILSLLRPLPRTRDVFRYHFHAQPPVVAKTTTPAAARAALVSEEARGS